MFSLLHRTTYFQLSFGSLCGGFGTKKHLSPLRGINFQNCNFFYLWFIPGKILNKQILSYHIKEEKICLLDINSPRYKQLYIINSFNMSEIYVGTGYNQILKVPLDSGKAIEAYGEKKRNKIMNIHKEGYQLYYGSNQAIYKHDLETGDDFKQLDHYDENHMIGFNTIGDKLYTIYDKGEIYTLAQNKLCIHVGDKRGFVKHAYDGQSKLLLFGKAVLPFIYDLHQSSAVWRGKNVPNDELDLQVPIDDVDGVFLDQGKGVALAHAFNKVRLYDVRSNRRKPTHDQEYGLGKGRLTVIEKSDCSNYLFLGSESGSINQIDRRKNLSIIHKFKGITTTITDLAITPEWVISTSLDGYLRAYNRETRELQFKRYLNTHPMCICFDHQQKIQVDSKFREQEVQLNEEVEEMEEKQKVKKIKFIRKRNKVGLKYLMTSRQEENQEDEVKHENRQDDIQ